MKHPSLFQPIMLGNIRVKNRLYMAPIHAGLSVGTYGGMNDRYIEYYRERAKDGVGLIFTGHVKAERRVDPYPYTYGLCLDDRNQLKGYRELTEAVHAYGAKIAVQLSVGAGRLADTIADGFIPAAPSAMPVLYFPKVATREITHEEIATLVKAYGKAAANAKAAGFDFIEVHAMAHLFDQFLTPAWNKRTDEYGGSLENRMRFLLECIESAQAAVGPDFPLIASISMDDGVEGGKTFEDVLDIARALESKGIVALHVRNGCYDRMDKFITSHAGPFPQPLDNAARIREAINIPVLSDGSLHTPSMCSEALDAGLIDMVGLARPLIADAQWVGKARRGSDNEIRPCLRCMKCLGRVGSGRAIGCTVNPKVGREILPTPTLSGRKHVLVVGGSLSGLLCALYAAERGHEVTLVEESDRISLLSSSSAESKLKPEEKRYAAWLGHELETSKATVKLGVSAEATLEECLHADAVVLAGDPASRVSLTVDLADKGVIAHEVPYASAPHKLIDANRAALAVAEAI